MKKLDTIISENRKEAVELLILKKHGKTLCFVNEDMLDLSNFDRPKAKEGVEPYEICKEHGCASNTWVLTAFEDVADIRLLAVRLSNDDRIECVGFDENADEFIAFNDTDCLSNSENNIYLAIGAALDATIE